MLQKNDEVDGNVVSHYFQYDSWDNLSLVNVLLAKQSHFPEKYKQSTQRRVVVF